MSKLGTSHRREIFLLMSRADRDDRGTDREQPRHHTMIEFRPQQIFDWVSMFRKGEFPTGLPLIFVA